MPPYEPGKQILPIWSPDGRSLAYFDAGAGNTFVMEVGKLWKEQSPRALPAFQEPNARFVLWSWSPDGRRLAGFRQRPESGFSGTAITVYSMESQRFSKVADSGIAPVWLKDSRRLLFTHEDKLYLVDSQSKRVREIFSAAPKSLAVSLAISRDNRTIYLSLGTTEADIWLMNLE